MDFKKYDEIIKNNKYDMLFLDIYYTLQLNESFKKISNNNKKNLIFLIYDAYLKDESHIDLSFICDIAYENKNVILKNNDFSKWDLLELCYNSI